MQDLPDGSSTPKSRHVLPLPEPTRLARSSPPHTKPAQAEDARPDGRLQRVMELAKARRTPNLRFTEINIMNGLARPCREGTLPDRREWHEIAGPRRMARCGVA